MAEEELARGAANWPVGDPHWIALEDDISSSVTEDDFSDDGRRSSFFTFYNKMF